MAASESGFLLERHSPALVGTPLDRLIDPWRSASDGFQDHVEPLLQASFTGIFEVGEIVAEQGAWLRDISGFGEYALADPKSSAQIQPGDLLVGRLFPLPGSLHLASGQAMWLRNPELTRALEKDLSQARELRRNILHIDAPELERMFFAAEWGAPPLTGSSTGQVSEGDHDAAANAATDTEDLARKAVARAEAYLLDAGWSPARVDALLEALRGMPWQPNQWTSTPNDPVGHALETLAFESAADLTEARQVLTTAWQALSAHRTAPKGSPLAPSSTRNRPVHPHGTQASRPGSEGLDEAAARRAALERFDAARAQGGDLESQLAALEADLGLAPEVPATDSAVAPDFPGVVSAMVAEWRWDRERQGLPALGGDLGPFETYCADIGRFDALTPRRHSFVRLLLGPGTPRLERSTGSLRMHASARGLLRLGECGARPGIPRAFGANPAGLGSQSTPSRRTQPRLEPTGYSRGGCPRNRPGTTAHRSRNGLGTGGSSRRNAHRRTLVRPQRPSDHPALAIGTPGTARAGRCRASATLPARGARTAVFLSARSAGIAGLRPTTDGGTHPRRWPRSGRLWGETRLGRAPSHALGAQALRLKRQPRRLRSQGSCLGPKDWREEPRGLAPHR